MAETYEYVQVSGGKFHRTEDGDLPDGFRFGDMVETRCGRSVHVLNVFETEADALHYCGGRREYLCSQCNK